MFGISRSARKFFRPASICSCFATSFTANCALTKTLTSSPRARPLRSCAMNCPPRRIRPLADRSSLAILAAVLITNSSGGATLLGKAVPPGGTLDLQFPINNYFQEYAARGGNPRPTTGRALIFFPKNFDPSRTWPILIVTSTIDFGYTSPEDAPRYRDAAMAEGWIVLATDATIRPRADTITWR